MRGFLLSLLFVVFSVTPIALLRFWDLDTDDAGLAHIAPAVRSVEPKTSTSAGDDGFLGVVRSGEAIEVAPKAEGKLESVLFRAGAKVRRGTPLARLDTRALREDMVISKATLAEMTARSAEAQARYQRRRALHRYGGVAKEEIEEARAQTKALSARLVAQRARITQLEHSLEEAELRAPFDGVVAAVYASPGALAGPTKPVLRLLSEGDVEVRFAVPEGRAGEIHTGDRVRLDARAVDVVAHGSITSIAPEVDSGSHMIFATARLESGGHGMCNLVSGTVARVGLVR
jgi:membrane fusion protein (multidrug efflux system)/multidrug efflux system membrane fusion protein